MPTSHLLSPGASDFVAGAMRARLVDVAARAGVAPNTASTILNNRPNSWASKETRDRVLKAAKELDYKPSKAALGLRLGRFFTLGLVIPDIHNPFYTTFADLLDKAVSPERNDLIIEHSRTNLEQEKHCFESILGRQVDGVALFISDTELHRPFLEDLAKRKIPAVALAVKTDNPLPVDSVLVDFAQGLQQAVEHLIGHGHRRFAFLCALAEGQEDGQRPALFRQLLSDNGIPSDQVSYVRCAHDIDNARGAFRRFLQSTPRARRPTAVIALNDLSAIGAIRAAVDEGLAVPRDLSVIGVDNIPLGLHLPVALTTIAQPIEDMARRTANLLLQRISGQRSTKPSQTFFPTELVVRESTGRAPL
ncbi:LacI family transcriptional regulator [bacterium]|nr:LacI family transcriptional regulator [bacterium]